MSPCLCHQLTPAPDWLRFSGARSAYVPPSYLTWHRFFTLTGAPIHPPLAHNHFPMSTVAIFRLASRTQPHRTIFRSTQCCPAAARRLIPANVTGGYGSGHTFSTTVRGKSNEHGEETFEEFSARYAPRTRCIGPREGGRSKPGHNELFFAEQAIG